MKDYGQKKVYSWAVKALDKLVAWENVGGEVEHDLTPDEQILKSNLLQVLDLMEECGC